MADHTHTNETFVADFFQRIGRAKFEDRAARGASALRAMGAGEDVPVAIIMRNDLTHLEIMRAAALAGTVIVALNWHAIAEEVTDICDDSGAEFVIVHRDLIEALRPALSGRHVVGVRPRTALCEAFDIDPGKAHDGAEFPEWSTLLEAQSPTEQRALMRPLLRYTSGSTGKPKGVRRLQPGRHKNFEDVLRRVGTEMLQLEPGARFFTATGPFGGTNHSQSESKINPALVWKRLEPEIRALYASQHAKYP